MTGVILSAGMVIVRFRDAGPCYLLLRVYRYWDFPKGEVVPGEDALDTALREAREETGLTDLTFPWGPDYWETPVYGRGKQARYYLAANRGGRVTLPVSPELGRPEHHEYRWLAYPDACARLGPRVRAVLIWAHQRVAATVSG